MTTLQQDAAPCNLEAEESVLGAALLSAAAIDTAAEHIQPEHFYRDSNGTIFRAILARRQRGEPVDPLLVSSELNRMGVLEKVGGDGRLKELAALVSATSNVDRYALLVLEAARSRRLWTVSQKVRQAAANGGLTTHPELLDEMQEALADARSLPGEPVMPDDPLFVDAWSFIEHQSEAPEPLWGSHETPLLVEGGLALLTGRPGAGKTTFILDLACCLAAGIPFPNVDIENSRAPRPWPCSKPVRIAIIENEGPQEMFRSKLKDKLEAFAHPIREAGGLIVIQTWAWGSFSFADSKVQARVRRELDELQIDLVVGDPLASLGVEGVGTPAETGAFVSSLKPLGLGTIRSFLFLHHFRERVEKGEDELRRVSGAWGPHLDTLLTLQATHSENEARLNYPKVRWARGPLPKPIILGRVWNTASFEAISDEGDATHLEPKISDWLAQNGWRKLAEIATGIKQRRVEVKGALEGAPHLFRSATGDEAKRLGARTASTILWGLADWRIPGSDEEEPSQLEVFDEDAHPEEPSDLYSDDGDEPKDDIPFHHLDLYTQESTQMEWRDPWRRG